MTTPARRQAAIVRPQAGDEPEVDALALAKAQDYASDAVTRIEARSEKWIAGLAAVTAVLAASLVVKGPENFSKIEGNLLGVPFQVLFAVALVIGGLLIAYSVFKSYSAAYGSPLKDDPLLTMAKRQTSEGAFEAYFNAVDERLRRATTSLREATLAAVVGTLILSAAVLATWLLPTKPSTQESFCVKNGTTTIEIEGTLSTIVSGELTVVPCS